MKCMISIALINQLCCLFNQLLVFASTSDTLYCKISAYSVFKYLLKISLIYAQA